MELSATLFAELVITGEARLETVTVRLLTEEGCNPEDGEYALFLTGISFPLFLNCSGGSDDVSLIKEAIENELDFSILPESGEAELELELHRTGEQEDVSWHTFYKIITIKVLGES